MSVHGVYVTGTDTGIGKTFASCALLHALRKRGARAAGMKPVASGCDFIDGRWRNGDALALQQASAPMPDYADLNPYALPEPLAPELAAADAGMDIALDAIVAAHARLRAQADVVVVEGVGGWAAPLSATLDQAHVARALRLPVLLVVGLRLGCLNHAYLTARAIAADGLQLVGWVASDIDPGMARADDNFALLSQRLPAPCWGRLPHAPGTSAEAMARHLEVPVDGLLVDSGVPRTSSS